MNLLETLKWRYATKKYSDKKVSEEDLQEIIDAIHLSASSTGLQPYRLIVVDDPKIRKELGAHSFNSQVIEASHLLVFAAFTKITKDTIENYIRFLAKERNMPEENFAGLKGAIEKNMLSNTTEENFTWSAKQAYIALGTGLIAAANLHIDATPMEGFDAPKFDTILGLKEKGLKSVVLLSLGYRDAENDFLVKAKKVRIPKSEFVTEIKELIHSN